jgi:hypothetical protein
LLGIIFTNQVNFIYKGKTFKYSFDPIYQELLDNMDEYVKIESYINNNYKLANTIMQDVIPNQKYNEIDLLNTQLDAIISREDELNNTYNALVFNRNKKVYKLSLDLIEEAKQIKEKLSGYQDISTNDVQKVINENKNELIQLNKDISIVQQLQKTSKTIK